MNIEKDQSTAQGGSNMKAKIGSEKDLQLFLELLAEEAVKDAYETAEINVVKLFEQDDEEEDPLFGGGDDKGEEDKGGEEDLPDLSGDNQKAPEPEEEPAEDKSKEKVEVRPTPLTLELGEVTSDGLLATLNMIRAGRSLKEPDVAAQMKKYFEEQLNDSEKLALATFLSAIRDLTSGTPAEDAPEPGDENVSINATGEEQAQQAPAPERNPSQPALQQQQRMPQQQSPRGIEDTSPPIQVGPRNARLAEEYREQIRSLLIK